MPKQVDYNIFAYALANKPAFAHCSTEIHEDTFSWISNPHGIELASIVAGKETCYYLSHTLALICKGARQTL